MPHKPFLSLQEVASETGYLADTLRQLAIKKKIPAVKMGRDWFIEAKDLDVIKRRRNQYINHSRPKSIFKEAYEPKDN